MAQQLLLLLPEDVLDGPPAHLLGPEYAEIVDDSVAERVGVRVLLANPPDDEEAEQAAEVSEWASRSREFLRVQFDEDERAMIAGNQFSINLREQLSAVFAVLCWWSVVDPDKDHKIMGEITESKAWHDNAAIKGSTVLKIAQREGVELPSGTILSRGWLFHFQQRTGLWF
ncbi:hypothetical protein JG687_00009973 [Phytophthora cactorum]|uniref:Uncharacterized protein n=1 Tax=Phytophthora cactorum TaxID=29920 RepID=A0A8T1UAR9_9STRA|nr:hypothetical protein JG687_00009973 [Phytophthora cactorum]